MAYDEKLSRRIRKALSGQPAVTERAMFGGLAFLMSGRMICGIVNDELMVRVGPDRHEEALAEPHVRPMDFTGRPMKGYVFVAAAGCRTDAAVARWVQRGSEFVATLGAKKPRRRGQPRRPARTRTKSPR
jgi:TfoX/Sxy family transcriptional regulator of competence genes